MPSKLLELIALFLIVWCSYFVDSTYDIYRSSCRRYAVLKLQSRNQKLTGSVLASSHAEQLADCARKCTQEPACKTINYKKQSSSVEENCEILGNEKSSNTFVVAPGWSFYEPLTQNVIPACMLLGDGIPCSPGYRCEESCSPDGPRFTCVDINECASNPCVHGSCSNNINSFSCSCDGGWTGTRCDIDINECSSGPCKNGGTCHNRINSYSCSCTILWGGTNCGNFLGIGKK